MSLESKSSLCFEKQNSWANSSVSRTVKEGKCLHHVRRELRQLLDKVLLFTPVAQDVALERGIFAVGDLTSQNAHEGRLPDSGWPSRWWCLRPESLMTCSNMSQNVPSPGQRHRCQLSLGEASPLVAMLQHHASVRLQRLLIGAPKRGYHFGSMFRFQPQAFIQTANATAFLAESLCSSRFALEVAKRDGRRHFHTPPSRRYILVYSSLHNPCWRCFLGAQCCSARQSAIVAFAELG